MPSFALHDARDLAVLWQTTLGRLRFEVNEHAFAAYLEGTRPSAVDGSCLIVEAPRPFALDWLNFQFAAVVGRVVSELAGVELSVTFLAMRVHDAAPLFAPPAVAVAPTRPGMIGALNCAYTFESYVVADGNKVAHGACHDATAPGLRRVSPIVLYGRPGMGKTHLLHAVANRARAAGWAVACLSAEEFTNEYQGAVRERDVRGFQTRLRNVQLLVIDDLQYLAGKIGTQDELVRTIEAVSNQGGVVAIASEVDPDSLDLPDRLRSRLRAGLRAPLVPLRRAERAELAGRILADFGCPVPPWAIERIAQLEAPSVRDLQGAVNAVALSIRHHGLDLGRLDAELLGAASGFTSSAQRTDRDVIDAIARHFDTTFEELTVSRRPGPTKARAVAVALLQERGRSLAQISSLVPRDRSTIRDAGIRGREILHDDPLVREAAG